MQKISARTKKLLALTLFSFLLLVLRGTNAKLSTGAVVLNGEGTEHFLSKFSIGIGVGRLEAKFWVEDVYDNPRELSLYIYCDEDWPSVQEATTCRDKIKYSRRSEKVAFQHHEHYEGENIIGRPNKVAQVFRVQVNLTMHIRTHYWYFMLADCTLEEYYHEVPKIFYNVEVYNEPGDNHLSADEMGLPSLYNLKLMIMSCVYILFVYLTIKNVKKTGSIHLILILLFIAGFFDVLSTAFELMHLSMYARDGIGSSFCDTMAAVSELVGACVVAFILLSVSSGWTLANALPMDFSSLGFRNKNANSKGYFYMISSLLRKPSNFLSGINFASVGLVLLLLLHIGLIMWGKLYSDTVDTFHDFEHLPGKLLMLFRLLCGLYFWFAVSNIIKLQDGGEITSFLLKFRPIGTVWFLSLPVAVCCAPLWAEYLRHWWITCATVVFQTIALFLLSYTLIIEKTSYFHKSTVGTQNIVFGSVNVNDFNLESQSSVLNATDKRGVYSREGVNVGMRGTGGKSVLEGVNKTIKAIRKARVHMD